MNRKLLWYLSVSMLIIISSCSEEEEIFRDPELTSYELEIISYFKEVALGYEFGDASNIVRKWEASSTMSIYVAGNPSDTLLNRLQLTITEINGLATDGFQIEIVSDSSRSNCYVFFGSASDFIARFPETSDLAKENTGLFTVWHNNNIINRARIFINTQRPTSAQQQSIVMEEITQAIGIGRDSPRYSNSIFFETNSDPGFATEYSSIDQEVIRLLYHPKMRVGLHSFSVDQVLRSILTN